MDIRKRIRLILGIKPKSPVEIVESVGKYVQEIIEEFQRQEDQYFISPELAQDLFSYRGVETTDRITVNTTGTGLPSGTWDSTSIEFH